MEDGKFPGNSSTSPEVHAMSALHMENRIAGIHLEALFLMTFWQHTKERKGLSIKKSIISF